MLAAACKGAGRDRAEIRLLGVAKKQPIEKIRAAAGAGLTDFGENFVQEGLDKMTACADLGLTWHFIGRLQSNKTRSVAENFAWVHSVDSVKIARRLSQQRPPALAPLNLCLQVNIDDEASKSGFSVNALFEAAPMIANLPNIRLRGLMCIPSPRQGFAEQRQPFAKLGELADELRAQAIPIDTLSMGMSGDFRAAIYEGATIVRIGTALFGKRDE